MGLAFLGAAVGLWFVMRPSPPPQDGQQIDVTPPTGPDASTGRSTALAVDDLILEEVPDAGVAAAEDAGRRIVYRYERDDWDCTGAMPAATARQVVAEFNPQVRNCYERALKQNNTLQGTLSLQLKIDASGRVSDTRVGGTIRDRTVSACVQHLASSWRFPAPTGGRCAVVSAPFAFNPVRQ